MMPARRMKLVLLTSHQMRQGHERSKMRHPLQKYLEREREREYIDFFSVIVEAFYVRV